MATLRVTVLFPTTLLPDTPANRNRMFVFSGVGSNANGTGPFGNLGRRNVEPFAERAYNWNNPMIAGAIAVTPYDPVFFDSIDLNNDQSLIGQLANAIESGYIQIDTTPPGAPLTRTDLEAFL